MNKEKKESTQVDSKQRLSLKEKLGYAFTDTAGNLLYVTLSSFIMFFYTDIMNMPASGAWSAATVLLIARVVNALLSIVWGSIIDHTKTKWGQSRPWFLWLAGPFIVTTWLCFLGPDLGGNTMAKFFFAMITYILSSGCVYTGLSAGMSAVLPNLTNNSHERIKASSFRMLGGSVGAVITSMCTSIAAAGIGAALFANENSRYGWWIMVALWCLLAGIMLVCSFLWLKERNFNPDRHKPLPFLTSVKALKGNIPWFLLVSGFVVLWVAQSTRDGTSIYFAEKVLNNGMMQLFIRGIQIIGVLVAIVTPLIVKALGKISRASKTLTLLLGLGIAIIGQAGMALTEFTKGSNEGSQAIFVIFWTIGVIGAQLAMGMFFAMIADTVDYGEYKTGIHAPGLLASVGASFSIQLGSAFGAYVPLTIMGNAGYISDKDAIQPESAIEAIKFIFVWLPVIIYAIVIAIMIFYIRYERNEEKIRAILAEKNKQF